MGCQIGVLRVTTKRVMNSIQRPTCCARSHFKSLGVDGF